jgi:outer membrane protein assembly factor BamB
VSGRTLLNGGVALDIDTGERKWGIGGPPKHAPSAWSVNGTNCFLVQTHRGVKAVLADSGKELWTAAGGALCPSHTRDRLVLMTKPAKKGARGRVPVCYAIDLQGATELWKGEETYLQQYYDPIIANGHVYFISFGQSKEKDLFGLYTYDLATGKKLQRIARRRQYWGAATDGRVFMPAMEWYIAAETGLDCVNRMYIHPGWKHDVVHTPRQAPHIGVCMAPAIADGRFIYRGRNAVYCVDLRGGR